MRPLGWIGAICASIALTSAPCAALGLAILTRDTPEIDRYYSREVANGFVVPVEQADGFENALKRKLFYEVAGAGATPVAVMARATARR